MKIQSVILQKHHQNMWAHCRRQKEGKAGRELSVNLKKQFSVTGGGRGAVLPRVPGLETVTSLGVSFHFCQINMWLSNTASFPLLIVQYQTINMSGKGTHSRWPGSVSFGTWSSLPPHLLCPQECQGRLGRAQCLGTVCKASLPLQFSSQGRHP